jgi:lipopolysaccharide/colanic/teichoic acid biosynthesis glycosyltransferase
MAITKRLFDVLASVFGLLMLGPVFLILAVAILFSMGRPILFRQMRAGLDGRDFTLSKFRSMRNALGPDGTPLPDEVRVTRVGRILRRFRVDELPEFWLIATGKMSFVGPRPLPRSLLEEKGVLEARCRSRPGLTGLAQVSGNTLLTNTEKFAIDLYYVDHHSLLGDLRIILATVRTVIAGERRDEPLIRKALQHAHGSNRGGW